ncbi:hypothetical protein [Castellaniella sp.]|uniref:hypothetical protein n=1 Tax=Castellaniella sp. TaxID=1955812 RepID=UPI002AFE8373|nr:hypothetical protein [Castellaniella sp.]
MADELENLTFLKMVICVYQYALDLLDVMKQLDSLVDACRFRLRQHFCFAYYDPVLYASPVAGTAPPSWVQ